MRPFVGSKISLISTSEVRYEGTLKTLDPQDSTIALQNVRQMGTEDRRTDKVIKASPTVYEYVIFRGDNIKDIRLMEEDAVSVVNTDPAVLEAKPSEFLQPNQQKWPKHKKKKHNYKGGFSLYGESSGGNYHRRGRGTRRASYRGWNGRGSHIRGYRQNHGYSKNHGYVDDFSNVPGNEQQFIGYYSRDLQKNNRRRGGKREHHNKYWDEVAERHIPGTGKFLKQKAMDDDADLKIPDKDFDFQGNLARFDMSSLKEGLPLENPDKTKEDTMESWAYSSSEHLDQKEKDNISKGTPKEGIESADKKDDFFDSLSTDTDVRNSRTGPELRSLNVETFGKIGSTNSCRSR